MKSSLSPQDHLLLAGKIRKAEATTRGEIYCVVARESDSYFFPAAFMLVLGMIAASVAAAFWLDHSWLHFSHADFALIQLLVLAAAIIILWRLPHLAHLLAPHRLRYRRAHDNAMRQFLAHNVHQTQKRTGILIFVSLAERYATVIADAAIAARVPQSAWDEIVATIVTAAKADRLTEGLSEAIDRAGALLSEHFPGNRNDPNELDDHVVEI